MNNHCAVTCPVVTEAVKAATPQSKIAMAIAAIESDKISIRAAAERFGVPVMTLQRKAPTVPLGTVGVENEKPKGRKGKDGRVIKPPAKPSEIVKAWEMKELGATTPAIAKTLGRGEQTVRDWFKKDRPEAIQKSQTPVKPDCKPQKVAPPPPLIGIKIEIEPESTVDQKPTIPDNLKQFHQRESRRFKEKWQEAALNLRIAHDLIKAERDRLNNEFAGKHGSLLMQGRWQQLAAAWRDCGFLEQFGEITTKPTAVTLEGLLEEMARASRMTNEWIQAIQVYTGCKPCSTRYKGENGNGACAVQNNDKVLV